MAENTNSPNEPQKLDDTDLASVSGGTIPVEILDMVEDIPDKARRTYVMSFYPDNEEQFMKALYDEMWETHQSDQVYIIGMYCRKRGINLH